MCSSQIMFVIYHALWNVFIIEHMQQNMYKINQVKSILSLPYPAWTWLWDQIYVSPLGDVAVQLPAILIYYVLPVKSCNLLNSFFRSLLSRRSSLACLPNIDIKRAILVYEDQSDCFNLTSCMANTMRRWTISYGTGSIKVPVWFMSWFSLHFGAFTRTKYSGALSR